MTKETHYFWKSSWQTKNFPGLNGLKLNGSTFFYSVKDLFLHNNSRVISYKSGAFCLRSFFLLG
jgi:hypothetical protein